MTDYTIIYKLKGPRRKSLLILEDYIGLQSFIRENECAVDLKIIERSTPITFFINKGLVIFEAHLRLASTPLDVKKLISYQGRREIVLIAPPFFQNTNAFNKLKNIFKIIDVAEYPDE